jgi:hypothetical protein
MSDDISRAICPARRTTEGGTMDERHCHDCGRPAERTYIYGAFRTTLSFCADCDRINREWADRVFARIGEELTPTPDSEGTE